MPWSELDYFGQSKSKSKSVQIRMICAHAENGLKPIPLKIQECIAFYVFIFNFIVIAITNLVCLVCLFILRCSLKDLVV